MRIGVVMVGVNLFDKYSKPALDSIKSKYDLYIVYVDNGSTDNTLQEAMKLVNENFHYKRFETNGGLQKAWNYGINDCFVNHDCKYVFVPNNDVLLHPEAIDRLVDRFLESEEFNNAGFVASTCDQGVTMPITEDLVLVTCMNIAGECLTPQDIFAKDPTDKVDVPESVHPDFAAFMINRTCWETIGEFDELFAKAYFEDNCFHRRIKLAGLKAITLPTALFYHYGSRTQNQDLNPLTAITKSQMFEKNRRFYIQKWGGGTDEEKFTHPFNDPKKDLRWTLQSSHAEDCDCEVKCREIRRQKL